MKINIDKGVGLKSNSESSKKIKMKINADMGMALVTRYLYSNPIQTLTQEYLCNGRDATRAAKKNDPLQVTLPTKMDPTLKIRDFGNGISDDLMENVFCVLGESEKRSSDELTGGFGIGAKSGWAYTDSFMIRSIVNGESSLYLAHMGESQSGTLELINKEKTSEPNGVEIQINVKEADIPNFHKAVFRATQFWDVKPVIKGVLSEEIPKHWSANPIFKGSNWALFYKTSLPNSIMDENSRTADIVFAIDKIAYRLNDNFNELPAVKKIKGTIGTTLLQSSVTLVVFVNNNDVEVAANREDLNSNDYSKKQTEKILSEVLESISSFRKKEALSVKSVHDMIKLHLLERSFFNETAPKEITINGIDYIFKNDYRLTITSPDVDCDLRFTKNELRTFRGNRQSMFSETTTSVSYSSGQRTIIVIKDTKDGPGLTRDKIRSLFNLVDLNTKWRETKVYLIDRPLSSAKEKSILNKIDKELSFVKLSDVKLPEKVRSKFTRPTSKGKIVIHELSSSFGSIIDTTKYLTPEEASEGMWLYVQTDEGKMVFPQMNKKHQLTNPQTNWCISKYEMAAIIPFFKSRGFKICTVTTRKVDRVKALKNFKCLDSFLLNPEVNVVLSEHEIATIKDGAWRSLPTWIELFRKDLSVVKDKDVHELVKYDDLYSIRRNGKTIQPIPEFIRRRILPEQVDSLRKEVSEKIPLITKISERYPLIKKDFEAFPSDVLVYVNSKYKEFTKKAKE